MNSAEKLTSKTTEKNTDKSLALASDKDKAKNNVPAQNLPVKKKRRGCLFPLTILLLLTMCAAACAAVLAVTWATGHLPKAVCQAVLPNSPAYNRINCGRYVDSLSEQDKQDGQDSDFPLVVNDSPAPPAVTDGPVSFDVARIFEEATESIVGVGIKGTQVEDEQIIGSGFVISATGLIATNQHVVSSREASYYIKFEGKEEIVDVTEIYRDSINDIAILKVSRTDLKPLTLGNSDTLKPGQSVVAIGNPLGQLSSTVTSGIISGLNREVEIGESFLRTRVTRFEDTIQTDAAINPGNSGGPLLDANGRVIGINFATLQGFDNLSFAIPVSYLRMRVEELREFGKFRLPYLGVQYRNRIVRVGTDALIGAQIESVDPNSPAAKVLRKGDIVVSFGDDDFETTSLFNHIQKSQIGQEIELGVIRGAEQKREVVKVKIGESPLS